ncbi:MAG: hypothetical protein GKR91_10350 [Pseudomonadales bacterium]|nr:hypothetical protein [Pseudomonadales bacterium]
MRIFLQVLITILLSTSISASEKFADQYSAPQTEYGQPDLQGYWFVGSLTPVERPENFSELVTTPEEAEKYIESVKANLGDFADPDVYLQDFSELDQIEGQFRTSVVTHPIDGKIPYSERGIELVAWNNNRQTQLFDHPEQRNLFERCLGSFGFPPMRPFIGNMPRRIVQNENYIAIYTEDPGGARIIRLTDTPMKGMYKSYGGYSIGNWEGDTLVVNSTHFRNGDPARLSIGRAVLVSEESHVVERFTRISNSQLLYQFTIEDTKLYTEPWRGEFSFRKTGNSTYEYSCHEGNYNLPGILLGGRLEQERIAKQGSEDNALQN